MKFDCAFDGAIVKNTFIDFRCPDQPALLRCSSAPAIASNPEEEDKPNTFPGKLQVNGVVLSDASMDAQTDASTCSECEGNTPMDSESSCMEDASSDASPKSLGHPEDIDTYSVDFTVTPPVPEVPSRYIRKGRRLNAKANAFQPQANINDPMKQHYGPRFAEVIIWAKKIMQDSEHVKCVQVDDTNGWTFILQPRYTAEGGQQTEQLIAIAREALLEATSKSKCIYVQGYAGPNPFTMKPQGFETTLAAMENARNACYHVFKKGFCRHGDECTKQHPVCKETVQVIVEHVSSSDSCGAQLMQAFRQEVAAIAMMVTATLGGCAYADKVEAFENKGCLGWTIEVTPKEEMKLQKECLLSLAKNALAGATRDSNTVYTMGYAAKPFFSKPDGFVTILGDMHDEAKACWDLYSKGFCTRDCNCRWQHPKCLMPFNIVVKERSSLQLSAAMVEYLAGNGIRAAR